MCTLSLILRQSSQHSLIVAANRDESLSRPADPPFVWNDRRPRLIAGRDQRAGGTWMGLNQRGIFAGLTNLWDGSAPDPARRSRGEAVLELLGTESIEAAWSLAGAWDAASFNPFLLVAADLHGRAFWCAPSGGFAPREIGPGIHSFGNRPPDDPENQKLERARADVTRVWEDEGAVTEGLGFPHDPSDLALSLARALGRHHGERGPAESLCVHTDRDFGTVSSAVFILGEERPSEGRLWYADGPPCTTRFEDRSVLLRELFQDEADRR
jgi:hypothetical protein